MDDKTELELRELKQKLSQNTVKMWLAVFGVALTISGIAIERYAAYEQRAHQAQLQRLQQIVERMTEIATEFDSLYADTIHVINDAQADSLMLALALDALPTRISDEPCTCKSAEAFIEFAEDLRSRLHLKSQTTEIREWSRALELDAIWESRTEGFSPDFELYFGESVSVKTKEVAESAKRALSNQFRIFGDTDFEAFANFRGKGAEFSRQLRVAIDRRSGRTNAEAGI